MDEVPTDEVVHYQLLVVKNLIGDNYTSEKVEAIEAQHESDNLWHNELKKEFTKAIMMEEASKQIIDGATELTSFIDMTSPGILNQSMGSSSQLGLRNKSIPARQRQ